MAAPAGTFNGIQMGPHTILDEGIEHTLDLIADTAGVNVVMPYSHAYSAALVKPLRDRADHGVPLTDNTGRRFPLVWVRTHDQYYRNTTLRHPASDPRAEHANRELFAELVAPARERGMKVYARVLESSAMSRVVTNYSKVVTRDLNDRPTTVACWNHPEYVGFWADTMEDLFKSYDLDGVQWGAERQGPLMNVISPWNNDPPACFCEFCGARARAAGVDPARAKEGFRALYTYVQGQMAGQPRPADGQFAGFVRVLLRYPEILGWETQYRLGRDVSTREEHHAVSWSRLARRPPAVELGPRLSRRAQLRGRRATLRLHQDHRVPQRALAAGPRLVSAEISEDDPRRGAARRIACAVLRHVRLRQGRRAVARRARAPRVFAGVRVSRDEAQRRERERQDQDLHGRGLRRAGQSSRRS
jgi:hypothetical protein